MVCFVELDLVQETHGVVPEMKGLVLRYSPVLSFMWKTHPIHFDFTSLPLR